MKGRWKQRSENANKWIATYKKAYRRKMSGMSQNDIEKEALSIYEAGGSKFHDLFVFNEVTCKNSKWEIKLDHDSTHFFMDNPTNDDQRFQYSTERIASLSTYMINREQLRNRKTHIALKNDLIEHI
ncbi:hypothetical protein ACS0TY_008582 [Phlomoides rotata]